jgi:hypothetical protein
MNDTSLVLDINLRGAAEICMGSRILSIHATE